MEKELGRAAACAVCGSREVRSTRSSTAAGCVLAECPRCDHRWTQPRASARARARLVRVGVRAQPEVASAA